MKKSSIHIVAFMMVFVMLLSACNSSKGEAETTPNDINPEITTPEVTTPEQTTPEQTTPEQPVELAPDCEHVFTRRVVLEQVTTQEDGKIANVCRTCGGWQEEILPAVKSIKILAIGNSFSDNALNHLPRLAKELGIEEIVVGKLYVGSCTVDGHWSRAQSGASYQRFDLNFGDGWASQSTKTLAYALKLYDWDVITMQQGSSTSGMPESLTNLQNLVDYVNANTTNPNAKLYWHMTWAYSQFTEHSGFANYNNDQITMYNAIADLSVNSILTNPSFTGVIPAGTAVQNYRGALADNSIFEGSNITISDGYHLNAFSQVLTSLTWLKTLTGLDLDAVTCTSHSDLTFVSKFQLKSMRQAVNSAYLDPYVVTPLWAE